MKKLLLICSVAMIGLTTQAQTPKEKGPVTVKVYTGDLTLNTDTTNSDLLAIGDNLASIEASVSLVSGTIGGKVLLYGRTGVNWVVIDSSNITAAAPFKTFLMDRTKYTYYKDYRCQYRTATTQTSYLYVYAVRRPEED